MFGRKNKNIKQEAQTQTKSLQIDTIPKEFYGGRDPVVYHGQGRGTGMKGLPKSIAGRAKPKGPSRIFYFIKSRLFLILFSIILFAAAVAGISWYYLRQSNIIIPEFTSKEAKKSVQPEIEIPVERPDILAEETIDLISGVPTGTIDISTTPEDIEDIATTTPSLEPQPIEFPSPLLADSPDLDGDSLTDREEEIFNTDPGVWDTDKDSYYDGLEVANLYNPSGTSPTRLIDSGLVREYRSSILGYRMYYPALWEVGEVDTAQTQVIFSTFTGDFIEVRAVSKDEKDTFTQWFARNSIEQKFQDLEKMKNRFGEEAYIRKDKLVGYFVDKEIVFVILYHPGTTGTVPYRKVMEMAIQSFRPSMMVGQIPEPTDISTSTISTTTEETPGFLDTTN